MKYLAVLLVTCLVGATALAQENSAPLDIKITNEYKDGTTQYLVIAVTNNSSHYFKNIQFNCLALMDDQTMYVETGYVDHIPAGQSEAVAMYIDTSKFTVNGYRCRLQEATMVF